MAISKPLLLVWHCAAIICIAIITARPPRINTDHLIANIALYRCYFPSTRPALAPFQAKKGSATITITITAANARSTLAVASGGPPLGRFPPAFASQRTRAHPLLSLPTRPFPVPQLRRAPRYPANNRNPPSPAPTCPPQHRHHRRQHASSLLHLHTPILPAHIRTS